MGGTTALYQDLAAWLRARIDNGTIPPGGRLPTELSLVEEHGVSRGTVREAIALLVAEGLVVSEPGKGHRVRTSAPLVWRISGPEYGSAPDDAAGDEPTDHWSRSVRAQGHKPSERIRVETCAAGRLVGGWLGIDEDALVVVRRRLRLVDDIPSSVADSYYPRDVVSGTEIELPGYVRPGVFAVFERIGRPWVSRVDQVFSRPPTREEAVRLQIPRGVSVAEVARCSLDADGKPVRLTRFILRGDRNVIEYVEQEQA